ncbi:MAG TPA: class I SAM-dependent methyltransferase [Micropepsaceae bacterium]|nr:class I SAM-dependent methyltransferase [Micropepsaceae bacterium]
MQRARIRALFSRLLRRHGKEAFVQSLPKGARLLDVGCGNNSPLRIKAQRPDIEYTGIDVGDLYQPIDPKLHADRYILTTKEAFASEIAKLKGKFDAVLSAANLEHCTEPEAVLNAMLCALAPRARLYVSFPCEASVSFPRRRGCLNFFDDGTHFKLPKFVGVSSAISNAGCAVTFAAQRYRPLVLAAAGLTLEPLSAAMKRTMPGGTTWALYGFESVIWAEKRE